MQSRGIAIWKKAPFLRLLLPLIAGIIIQWYIQQSSVTWCFVFILSFLSFVILFYLPSFSKFRLSYLNGICISLIFFSTGSLLTWHQDIRNNPNWFGNISTEDNLVEVTVQEPVVEKTRSFKALASVNAVKKNNSFIAVTGNIILYFEKDSSTQPPGYGSRLILLKQLQPIKNSGNPGGFDYKQYCLFQDITHQVFLKKGEFILIAGKKESVLKKFLFSIREKVLNILRINIHGEKEQGLAEALLIGYKDDLDKNLLQSYSNTGVVHIVAISGLHLGLIYGLLIQLLKPLRKRKSFRWIQPVVIILSLWLFSLLAGAQPSVLRSAVMFTCIVSGEILGRKTSIYNTLALSAFILLCYNPFWLWDVGFQLSYVAVLSIVIFMRPIYNLLYIKNKILDLIWKLNAVTLSAQILTTPLSLYHFHRFPNLFLFTNFIAVPLSSLILLGEILLCTISLIPQLAILIGKILTWLVWLMNTSIERIDSIPFSVWEGIRITIPQTILLIIATVGMSYWLIEKVKTGLFVNLFSLLFFFVLRAHSFIEANNQQKLVVYNIPRHVAMDVIAGRNYLYIGDPHLNDDDFNLNFHFRPSRILNRVSAGGISNFSQNGNCIRCCTKRILIISKSITFNPLLTKLNIDLLILSGNPKIRITDLAQTFNIRQLLMDGSAQLWKLNSWKKECDSLHIPYYNVNEKGAFVMSLR